MKSGIVITGGFNGEDLTSVEVISSTRNNHLHLPSLPMTISGSPSIFQYNDSIMLCGGWNNLEDCLRLERGKWIHFNTLNHGRTFASVATTTTSTFIFGGSRSPKTYEFLSKNSKVWELGKTRIPGGLLRGSAVPISQDEIWLLGGLYSGRRILCFNTRTHSFKELPTKLLQERYGHQCAFIPGKSQKLIITGGYSGGSLNSTEILNVETGIVNQAASMNCKRAYHGIGVLKVDNLDRIAVFGGWDGTEHPRKAEVYNAKEKTWDLTDIELRLPRVDFGCLSQS